MKGQPHSKTIGWPHRHFARTESTNTRARELAAAGAPHGTVITAGEQSAGRGRQGRTWTAPPGGALLYSAIVRPLQERHLLLPLAAPLAVCAAAEELAPGAECGVKWPNDVHLDSRKLAGILIEARPQDGWAVIGIGLNLTIPREDFPPDLRDTAISLFPPEQSPPDPRIPLGPGIPPTSGDRTLYTATPDAGDHAHSRADAVSPSASGKGSLGKPRKSLPAVAIEGLPQTPLTAAAVLSAHLSRWVDADPAQVLGEWRRRDVLKGRQIAWDDGSGVADGVDDRGYLVVVTSSGERVTLGAGEVHLRL